MVSIGELLISISPFGAYSKSQRDWIVSRDGKCVAPFKHKEDKVHPVEVHHIVGQRYGHIQGLTEKTLDTPQNGVTLCRNAHDIIHPDRVKARQTYHEAQDAGGNSFNQMFQAREAKLANRELTHNPTYDRQMTVVTMKNNEKVDLATFPVVRKNLTVFGQK